MGIDLTSLENAVDQLKSALDTYSDDIIQKNPIYKKHMRSAVIQAFAITYEATFKMIIRYLNMSSHDLSANHMSFNEIIRLAYKKTLVKSKLLVWKQYREKRGITSHTYDEAKAQDVFGIAPAFLDEARYVLSSIRERNSDLD